MIISRAVLAVATTLVLAGPATAEREVQDTKSSNLRVEIKGDVSKARVRQSIGAAFGRRKKASTTEDAARGRAVPKDVEGRRSKYLAIAKSVKPGGLPIALVDAVITRESRYRADARGSRGEVGLMQILPATGRGLAKQHGMARAAKLGHAEFVKWLATPENNLKLGMAYLDMCHKKAKKNVAATIGCYNAGPGNMWAWKSIKLTRKYVSFVNDHMASASK